MSPGRDRPGSAADEAQASSFADVDEDGPEELVFAEVALLDDEG